MPLYLTGSHSSRITKHSAPPANLRRTLSAPLSGNKRTKSFSRTSSFATAIDKEVIGADDDDDDEDCFGTENVSRRVVSTFNATALQNVESAIQYSTTSMFSDIPDRAGMNSIRIAELLNFHKSLPPLVSLTHVHAILSASSKTEREIQSLLTDGRLRKLKISGRGTDMAGLGEILILSTDYDKLIEAGGLPSDTVSTFCRVLRASPRASSIPARSLLSSHSTLLARSGFLVSSSFSGSRNLSLSGSKLVARPTISRAASGTFAAVGGGAAFEHLGGVGAAKRSKSEFDTSSQTEDLTLSVPNIGPYLRILDAGRNHLMELLRMSKHRQAPLYLLRERWDGAIDSDNRVSTAKRIRGEFSQILPAKTKKWRLLNGLNFDWALVECLGAGMIELFETHAVGLGVRALV